MDLIRLTIEVASGVLLALASGWLLLSLLDSDFEDEERVSDDWLRRNQ